MDTAFISPPASPLFSIGTERVLTLVLDNTMTTDCQDERRHPLKIVDHVRIAEHTSEVRANPVEPHKALLTSVGFIDCELSVRVGKIESPQRVARSTWAMATRPSVFSS